MLTEGGAIVGYWATGRVTIESAPASMIAMAITHANTGRSMKKRDIARPRQERLAGIFTGTACTGLSGWMFCRPSTISRSPGESPAVTSQELPMAREA